MATKQPQPRRIMQIVTKPTGALVALCADGTLWQSERAPHSPHGAYNDIVWEQLPGLPDPDADAP